MNVLAMIKKRLDSESGDTLDLIKNIALSFGVKGLSLIIVLASTPVYLAYFDDTEIVGLWFTLISILTWILTCDMGIGNGLRNELVYALSHGNIDKARTLVSSSYVFLCAAGCVVLCGVIMLSSLADWFVVFNVKESSIAPSDLRNAIAIILFSVVVQFILRLITSILYALQKAFIPGFLALVTNAALLIYCVMATALDVPHDIVSLAFVYTLAVNVPLFVASLVVFFYLRPDLRPSFRWARKDCAMHVLKLGAAFLWLQMMALLLNNTSSYLIALRVGNSQVVEYQIYYRIFTLTFSIAALVTTPIWSAVTKAKSEGAYRWLWKLYGLSIGLILIATVVEFALCVPLQPIFDIWLGAEQTIQVTPAAAFLFALYGSLLVWSNVITTYANGLQELRLQTVFLTIGAVANVPLAVWLLDLTGNYLGAVIANIVAYLPYLIIQTIWMTRHLYANAFKVDCGTRCA